MTDHAATFRALHGGPGLLVLANTWDAGSARVIASLGAAAIATTSAGVAWSHGYADGDSLPLPLHLATLEAIVRAVDLPVSADIEAGYATERVAVAANVRRVIETGIVGINIEDGDAAPEQLADSIAAIRAMAGPSLFINARTDVVLRNLAPDDAVANVLARAALYRSAGADGIFVPGLTDATDIAALVAGVDLPLNVMARPGLPDAATLTALGVRRLSAGSTIALQAADVTARLATGFLAGDSDGLFDTALRYPALNALMRPR
jgi:2-methylisocitrate lyase-like PEP mutase family enzyme